MRGFRGRERVDLEVGTGDSHRKGLCDRLGTALRAFLGSQGRGLETFIVYIWWTGEQSLQRTYYERRCKLAEWKGKYDYSSG